MSLILLQTSLLRMTGLGVATAPVDATDPHQLEGPGIHLRWSFPTVAADGGSAEAGWPEDGFTLYRRPAQAGSDITLTFPDSPDLLGPDGVLDLPLAGGRLEFDPALLAQTLADHPRAAHDMRVLLDAYPAYFTIRFDDPVRRVALTCEERSGAGPGARIAVLRAQDDDDAVDEAIHLGAAKATLVVSADRITHVRVYLDAMEITGLVATLAETTTDDAAWTEIVSLPPPTDWPGARQRIPRAWRDTYQPGFADLAAEVAKLFDSGDVTPRWLRADAFASSPGGGGEAPTWTANIQAQLQLFGIDPFLARLLGLLYADTSKNAASGDPFDYLVTATIDRPDGGELVGWVCYGLSTATGGPLEPPTGLTAATTPARVFVPDPATGVLARTARVALGWELAPLGAGGPLAGRPVCYDVEAKPDGATGWTLLTGSARVVPAASADGFGGLVYPDVLFADTRGPGTHAYRVRAIDIFGRRGDPSASAQATVADVVGPPPPVNVRVVLIDPLDPYVGPGDQALGPGLLVRFDYPRAPWLAGSDVSAFTIHTHVGSQDRSLDWRDAGTWGAAAGEVAARAPVTGRVTGVAVLTSTGDDRRVRVTTDLQVTAATTPGTLAAGDTEYPVVSVTTGRGATFELAWPAQLDLPDPAPGPCAWYPGYQVHIAGYAAPVDPATGTAIGQVAVGAVDADGNAGRVSLSAGFQAVDRAVPAAPGGFSSATGEVVASRADFYGRSRVTLTWTAGDASARYQVLRALDAAILAQLGRDPSEAPDLSPDELRQFGDDPAAEAAFGLITAAPVSETAYTDETLAGHAANRYVYRIQGVSASGVPGPLGPASPPVRVPDVVPPEPPRVVGAAGGDGVIALTIAANREPDADHYVVYRTSVASAADDVRRMAVAGTAAHSPGGVIAFTDPAPPPRIDLVYRVVCVDTAGNASAASRPVTGRCFSTAPPAPPHLSAVRSRDGKAAALRWRASDDTATVLLLRQPDGGTLQPVSTWLPAGAGAGTLTDTGLDPATGYRYLARAMNASRVTSDSNPVELPRT